MPQANPSDVSRSRNRLVNAMPKIGIRPTIDGRRQGVREALEAHTLGLARAVADLLSDELRHANGLPVECVIAEPCIGGVAEAARAAEWFEHEGVGITITVTPSWCYPSETMDMDPHRPQAIWGFNGSERPGAVYLAALTAAHDQKGLPIFKIYGRDVQDSGDTTIPDDVRVKLLRFARAGLAAARMRGTSYLGMGGVSMGIVGSAVVPSFFERYLDMRVESVDMTEFVRRIEEGIYDPAEFTRALAWARANCPEGPDSNPPHRQHTRAQKDRDWELSILMALIARDLMTGNPALAALGFGEEALGHNAIAAGFQGQRAWTDHFPNGDFMEAILCSSFDWDGLRQPYILATENDALNAVAMLWGHLLTGTAQIFSDVRTYWSPDAIERIAGRRPTGIAGQGVIHLMNSGPTALDGTGAQEQNGQPVIKPFWDATPDDVRRCLAATTWYPGVLEVFRGGGWSSSFRTRGGMTATMSRLNLVEGIGPVLQIAEGVTVDLPDDISEALIKRTSVARPTTWFVPRITGAGAFTDVYTVMDTWGANHGAVCYGHIGAELITLASMLRIPVPMHNVDRPGIFRPSAWASYGARDLEGADFRACARYGPLY
ncbi:MAG: L-fucose isomerase [Anaerolineae bacterium]|nr:L-fucose isomerase [Anaerolineae bacterium]